MSEETRQKTPLSMLLSRDEKKEYQLEQIQKEVEENHGIVKTKDILDLGIDYRRLLQYIEDGEVLRVKNGYYTTKSGEYSEEQLICTMIPDGILTMESALYYKGYLKKRPFEWKIAISKNTSKSRFKLQYPLIMPYYTEPKVMELGVEPIEIAGQAMQIYSLDRLICDVLKYEDKMERDDFRTAVLTYINDDHKDVAKLMAYARERKVLKKVQDRIGVWL